MTTLEVGRLALALMIIIGGANLMGHLFLRMRQPKILAEGLPLLSGSDLKRSGKTHDEADYEPRPLPGTTPLVAAAAMTASANGDGTRAVATG